MRFYDIASHHTSKILLCPTQAPPHYSAMGTNHTPACLLYSASYIWYIKFHCDYITAWPNRSLPEASSDWHHCHLSSALTRLLTHALGSNLSLVVRDCLSLDLRPLSHCTLCSSFLQWFVLLWHSSSYINILVTSINAYKEYTFHTAHCTSFLQWFVLLRL